MKSVAQILVLFALIAFVANTPVTADTPAGTPTAAQCQSTTASIQVADTCTNFCTLRGAGRFSRWQLQCTGNNGVRG